MNATELPDALMSNDADQLARLHARLAKTAETEGLLDVAYRTLDSPVGPLLVAASPAGTWSGVSPRFFQPSMSCARTRAGQRFSSMPSACRSCFSSRTWSSTSRMVKSDLRPTSSA